MRLSRSGAGCSISFQGRRGGTGRARERPSPCLPSGPPLSLYPRRNVIHITTSLTHNGRGRERHLSYLVKPPIQPASGLNSSLSATLAGRVNFAALLLCLVFVIVSHSPAPSAAVQLVLGSCVMRVPTRQSITYSAKDLCSVWSVDSMWSIDLFF